jgi:hypothetical protein
VPEKEYFGMFNKSKLLPENQLQMEYYQLLMLPDYLMKILRKTGGKNAAQLRASAFYQIFIWIDACFYC